MIKLERDNEGFREVVEMLNEEDAARVLHQTVVETGTDDGASSEYLEVIAAVSSAVGTPTGAASSSAPPATTPSTPKPLTIESVYAPLPAGMVLCDWVPCLDIPENQNSKFIAPLMVLGKNTLSAVGLATIMGVDPRTYRDIRNKVQKIVDEFKRSGTQEDNANVERLMNGTYSNPESPDKVLPSVAAIMAGSPEVEIAGLQAHHVLALRLYTTSSYKSINNPMRQQPYPQIPHPFAGTLYVVALLLFTAASYMLFDSPLAARTNNIVHMLNFGPRLQVLH
jgi:hypothetical protein